MRLAPAALIPSALWVALAAVEPPPAPAPIPVTPRPPAVDPIDAQDDDAEEDDIEVIRGGLMEARGFGWELGIAGAIGAEERLAGGLVRERDSGELLDGRIWGRAAHLSRPPARLITETLRERTAMLVAGSDARAGDEGEALASFSAGQRGWRGEMPLYAIEGAVGWSDERDWLASGDLTVGFAHVGVERDDTGRAYRFGARVASSPHRSMAIQLGIDRIISYQLDDDHFYVTESFVAVAAPLGDTFMLRLSGAYAHGSRQLDGSIEHGTQGAIELAWRYGSGF
ncbi:MAG TPA: hypothetical protein VEL07_07550 [Planctomycetota bacterium]|nr:hypothetical protein [Planctomycetota bacterium]